MLKNRLYIFILFILIHNYVVSQDHENISLANEYFNMGELNKARELYEKLARNSKNIPIIHDNYFELKTFLEKLFQRKVDLVMEESLKPALQYVKEEAVYA